MESREQISTPEESTTETAPTTVHHSKENSSESHSRSDRDQRNSKSESRSKAQTTSKSQKSASISPKHRLYKTLKRKPDFKAIEPEDFKYAYAAYKKGVFSEFEEQIHILESEESLAEAVAFREVVESFILNNYDFGWTLIAETPKGITENTVFFT